MKSIATNIKSIPMRMRNTLKVNLRSVLNDAEQWCRSKGKIELTVLSNKVMNHLFDQKRKLK